MGEVFVLDYRLFGEPNLPTTSGGKNECCYETNHAVNLLKELDKDRKGDKQFCDATICTESKVFSVHKCVVVASSLFFRKLFSSKMKEMYESKANITTVSAQIMEVVLDFIYTSKLRLDDDNVYDILCAADYLQLQTVKDYCSFHLREKISDENCLVMWNFAKLYQIPSLIDSTEHYITTNFFKLLKQEEYKELSAKQLQDFICLRNNFVPEIDIYNAVMGWVKHDGSSRTESLSEVFAYIQLSCLSKPYLMESVCKEELLFKSPGCAQMLVETLCDKMKNEQSDLGQEIAIIGGTPSECEVIKLNVSTFQRTYLPNLPYGRSGASAVIVANQLYVLGGHCYSSESSSKSFDSVISYSLLNGKKWIIEPAMIKPRRFAGCAFLNGYIYMCGGKAHNSMWLSSCERFNVIAQTWRAIPDMLSKRSEFGLVVVNGCIYAMGGCSRPNIFLDSVECFDPNVGFWREFESMNVARARFAACAHNGEIYVMGGENHREYLNLVEKYSFEEHCWLHVASLNSSRYNHAACVVGLEILVYGGTDNIEFYDSAKNVWKCKHYSFNKICSSIVRWGAN